MLEKFGQVIGRQIPRLISAVFQRRWLTSSSQNPALEKIEQKVNQLEESTNSIRTTLDTQNTHIQEITKDIKVNKQILSKTSEQVKHIGVNLSEQMKQIKGNLTDLETKKLPPQIETLKKETSEKVQSVYKQLGNEFSNLSNSLQKLKPTSPEDPKASRLRIWWRKTREYNQQNQGEWITGYGFFKLGSLGILGTGVAAFIDSGINLRKENLRNLKNIKKDISDQQLLINEMFFNNKWLSESISWLHLYSDISAGVENKKALENDLEKKLEINSKLKIEIEEIRSRYHKIPMTEVKIFPYYSTHAVTNQSSAALHDLATQRFQLEIAAGLNKTLLLHGQRELEQALAQTDSTITQIMKYANYLYNKNKLTKELKLDISKTTAIAFNIRGIINGVKGNFKESFINYTLAIKLNPNDAQIYGNRSWLLFFLENKEWGMADSIIADKLKPNDGMMVAGVAYAAHGMANAGQVNKPLFKTRLKFHKSHLNSSEIEEILNYTWWSTKEKIQDYAADQYLKALDLEHQNPFIWGYYGLFHLERHDIEKANEAFKNGENERSVFSITAFFQGYYKASKGEYLEAIKDFETAKKKLQEDNTRLEIINLAIEAAKRKTRWISPLNNNLKFTLNQDWPIIASTPKNEKGGKAKPYIATLKVYKNLIENKHNAKDAPVIPFRLDLLRDNLPENIDYTELDKIEKAPGNEVPNAIKDTVNGLLQKLQSAQSDENPDEVQKNIGLKK